MNKSLIKWILFIPSVILTFESLIYNLLFCILPAVIYRQGLFEYSMAVTNFDLNKIWIGFICFTLFIVYLKLDNSCEAVYQITYACSYIFIGLNLVLSTGIFVFFRLLGTPLTDMISLQKYFGAAVFTLYGLAFTLIPILLLLSRPEKILLDKSDVKIDQNT